MLLLPDILENSSRYPCRIVQVCSRAEQAGKIDLDEIKSSGFTRNFPGGFDGMQAYSDSKQAMLLFTLELHRRLELAGSDVKSVCATPGIVATGLLPPTLSWKIVLFYPFFRTFCRSTEEGAHGVLYAALAPDVKGGSYTMDGMPVATQSEISKDPKLAEDLWELSRAIMCPDMELPI